MIRLIGLDLDDTLLNSQKQISSFDSEIIMKCMNKGCKVVFVSGRPFSQNIINYFLELGLENNCPYYIAFNGEAIYNLVENECIYSDCLNQSDLQIINAEIKKLNISSECSIYCYQDDELTSKSKVHASYKNEYVEIESKYNLVDVKYLYDKFDLTLYTYAHKFMIAAKPELISQLYKKFSSEFLRQYNVIISMPCFIEIFRKNNDKYKALVRVAKMLSINEDEILAIGDSMNDLSMVKNANVGIAMGNSRKMLKCASKYVTDDCEHNGVGKALKKFVLGEE